MQFNKTIFFLPNEQFARFETLAKILSESNFGIPTRYAGNYGSCLIAVDMAYRLGISPLIVLQNTHDLEGKPTWSYHFVKVMIEASGLIQGEVEYEAEGDPSNETYRVRAKALRTDGRAIEGPWITWQMATLERWTDNISYTSMPEVMMRARATTFLGYKHFDALLLGIAVDSDASKVAASQSSSALATPPTTEGDVRAKVTPDHAPSSVFAAALAQTPVASPPEQPSEEPLKPPKADTKEPDVPKAKSERKPRQAKSAPAPAPDQTQESVNSAPPALGSDDDNGQGGSVGTQATEPAPNEGATVAPEPHNTLKVEAKDSKAANDGSDSFAQAFALVDSVRPTQDSLQHALKCIATFTDATEISDLYLVLIGVVERHVTALNTSTTPATAADTRFAQEVHALHTASKPYADFSADLASRRRELGTAYKAFHTLLAKQTARTDNTN